MTKEKILNFAKEKGYDNVEYAGKWRGYEVYKPGVDYGTEKEPAIIGLPLIILVKGNEIKLSTVDEAFAYLDSLPDDEE